MPGRRICQLPNGHDYKSALVAIIVEEEVAHAQIATLIRVADAVAVGMFNLDNVGPHVAKQLGGERPHQDGGEIDDFDAV